jgi:hypothetical protein
MLDLDVASFAFTRAWNVYVLINKGVDENDARRTSLEQFIRKRCAAGIEDPELLVVEGLMHLKKLGLQGQGPLE